MAELKKQGIYSKFNLNVGRTFRKEDGVAEYGLLGLAKAVTLFDDHIIDLEKQYARQLLTHTNPYTGNAYVNEPALILVEIVNENSLVEAWFDGRLLGENTRRYPSTWSDIPASYARQLDRRYNEWLKTAVSPSELLQMKREARVNQEDMLRRLRASEYAGASRLRFHAEAEFILQLERRFFVGILAAYGLLQDWEGVFFYTLEHDDPRAWSTKTPRNFDLCSDPVTQAVMGFVGAT